MDWHGKSSEAHKTVELALIKVPATVPVTDPTYGGAVVLNPGGPGGSGVGQVLRGGHAVRTVLSAGPDADNDADARNFDVIGFDPRGINNTRPLLSCFPNHLEAAAWSIVSTAQGLIGASDTSFDNLWSHMRALADGCSRRGAEEGIAKHMSTAPVARDIIEIFERHGEWREAEAKRLLEHRLQAPPDGQEELMSRVAYKKGREMVQYWGFSYGTILGAHLSAMFTHRIQRAALDGVAESHDYMAGGWSTNLQDTDMIFTMMAEYCWTGGNESCPIWDESGPAAIVSNVAAALSDLQHNPISVPGNQTHGPVIGTHDDYKRLVLHVVYNPLKDFPLTTQVLHELSLGQATTLAAWKMAERPDLGTPLSDECLERGPFSAACQKSKGAVGDATYGIECSDGSPRTSQTRQQYREYIDMLIAQSSLGGATWAAIQMPCTAWHARPAWRYDGDFVATTAHPIMFIGNTFDPVTPLRNAFEMAKGFEGAGVLHQNSEGHCTYASPSMCSGRALREYFQTGRLPSGATQEDAAFCEPDMLPLHGYTGSSTPPLPKGETDAALWDALVTLNQVWP